MSEQLILVDANDNEIGTCEKLIAHEQALLHRAFSIFIYNDQEEQLIQRRAACKYHSANLWANTCCGHPRPGETVEAAAKRRLNEELGFTCDLKEITTVSYNLPLENGLTEHEYTHIFKGYYGGDIIPNPNEVSETKWVSLLDLRESVAKEEQTYARWFSLYVHEYFDKVFI